jgi:PAS domain S-box-containing protein
MAQATPAIPATSSVQVDGEQMQFRILVNSIQDYAIYLLDPNGRVLSWNKGAERIKQYRANEVIGKHFSIFLPPEDVERGKADEELRIAAEKGRYEDENWRVRKDGSRFWASVVITALRDDNGKLTAFSKITRDLTEPKRLEEEVKRAQQDLERRVEERTAEL